MQVNGWNSDQDRERPWHPDPGVSRGNPDCWAPQSIPLNATLRRILLHGVAVLCLAPDVLGNPDGNPEPVGRRSCCGK